MAMRIPKPHWKKSHKCWYVKLDGQFHRLDPDKDKAFEIYAELLSKRNVKQGHAAPAAVTVRDVLNTYLDWVDGHRAKETVKWYRKYLIGTEGTIKGENGEKRKSKHSESGFANYVSPHLKVRDLKPYHLNNWLDSRYAQADDNTRAGAITAVQRAFNWAVDEGYIDSNPVVRVKKPQRTSRGEDAYITPEQWEKIVEAVEEGQKEHEVEPFLDYITVMRETGCRPQEIRVIAAKHLDHGGRRWVFPVKESKGKKEKRIVMLGDRAYEICRRLAFKHPEGPIFRNSDGRPWTNYAVANRYKRISEKVGRRVFAYAIRHTFATEAIINGADVITVARLMGHKDLSMLNKIYQHVSQDKQHMEATRKKAIERSA